MSLLKFKALADDTRIRLLWILFHYELSVNELVQILGMGQSRVSRHLKILSEAGLLQSRRDGLWVFYSCPAAGTHADFLNAILPFLPALPIMETDLVMAGHMLAERARRTRQFFNAMAENWDELNREVLGSFDLHSHVLEAMPQPCPVAVDLGCGTGTMLEKMQYKAGMSIGVDGSASMLDLCRERLGAFGNAISLRIGELSHLPLADNEANFACINLVLHHLPEPALAFNEIKRILAPDGTLFIADFLRHQDESMRLRYGDHWLGFEREDLEKFLKESCFTMQKTEVCQVGRKLSLILITAVPAAQ